jgi:acetyl-CoA carboxylase alpha subunit
VAVVTGEGGSGGALALAVADRVLMMEHAIYSVISPEGCAAILWEDASRAKDAAEVLRITAPDLLKLGLIDGIVPEPPGGAHRNWPAAAEVLQQAVSTALTELAQLLPRELVQQRYAKFRRMGIFEETT